MEEEVKYLEEVKSTIKNMIKKLENKIEDRKRDIVNDKRHLWQNMADYKTNEMYSTMNDDDLYVSILNNEIIKTARLYRSLDAPYFGRIDFNGDKYYIGLTSVYNDDDNYVYDWRAPIGNLYYNCGVGHASTSTVDGVIDGEITLKRQYDIKMGKLLNVYDTDLTVNDTVLQEVLSKSSSEHMRNIVSTIQKEQNNIIRESFKNNLIIEGTAGSGKTAIALHRIAYILYNSNLTNKNILIFSPNEIFTSYISSVLPELGEDNVLTITKMSLFSKYLDSKPSYVEFIEKTYEKDELDDVTKYKFSDEFKSEMDKFIKVFTEKVCFTKKIGLKKKFIRSDELNKMYHSLGKLSFNDRLSYIADKLCDLYGISSDNSIRLKEMIKKSLDTPKSPVDLYRLFVSDSEYEIKYEDLTPMMYLYFEINGYPSYSHIKHIVIDEVQDYTKLDVLLLKKIFSSASFTLLGDKNQIVNPYYKYNSLKSIEDVFKESKYLFLDKSYRSSAKIVMYADSIINIKSNAIRNDAGVLVERNNYDLLVEDIKEVLDKYKKVAIITKNEKEKDDVTNRLSDDFSKEIEKNNIMIIPVYLSKGLEYDAVFVLNKSSYKESEANMLYVAVTRCEHCLYVYD